MSDLHRPPEPVGQREGCGEVFQRIRSHSRHRPEERLRLRGESLLWKVGQDPVLQSQIESAESTPHYKIQTRIARFRLMRRSKVEQFPLKSADGYFKCAACFLFADTPSAMCARWSAAK